MENAKENSLKTLAQLKSGQLSGQKRLELTCGLAELPAEIFDLADSLEILVLSNNRLSGLPTEFGRLKKLRIVFFNNNQFDTFPAVLASCPALSMVSFKGNQLEEIGEGILPPTLRWLILTNNRLKALPDDIGTLGNLQKCMLAGNQLQTLPETLANCRNLELIRLSANRLQALPGWLLDLPRLAWLAYSGNPCCAAETARREALARHSLPAFKEDDLCLSEILGEGASGVIYRATWADSAKSDRPKEVAVKLFKGDITSDGSPLDEMSACMAAGTHPNLVNVLGRYAAEGSAGLVFSFIAASYKNLGNPPNLDTCTRDTYPAGTVFSLAEILKIARGIAAAIAHLHARGILHGDLYAHNILVNEAGESILGDFGAASFYDPAQPAVAQPLEKLESRAFGCLLEDLLERCSASLENHGSQLAQLRELQQDCLNLSPAARPSFAAICNRLGEIKPESQLLA